jgi:hypothetical protein
MRASRGRPLCQYALVANDDGTGNTDAARLAGKAGF